VVSKLVWTANSANDYGDPNTIQYNAMQYKDKDKKCHPAHCSPKWARGYGQVWLLRNGALSSPHDAVDGGGIDAMVMRRDL